MKIKVVSALCAIQSVAFIPRSYAEPTNPKAIAVTLRVDNVSCPTGPQYDESLLFSLTITVTNVSEQPIVLVESEHCISVDELLRDGKPAPRVAMAMKYYRDTTPEFIRQFRTVQPKQSISFKWKGSMWAGLMASYGYRYECAPGHYSLRVAYDCTHLDTPRDPHGAKAPSNTVTFDVKAPPPSTQ